VQLDSEIAPTRGLIDTGRLPEAIVAVNALLWRTPHGQEGCALVLEALRRLQELPDHSLAPRAPALGTSLSPRGIGVDLPESRAAHPEPGSPPQVSEAIALMFRIRADSTQPGRGRARASLDSAVARGARAAGSRLVVPTVSLGASRQPRKGPPDPSTDVTALPKAPLREGSHTRQLLHRISPGLRLALVALAVLLRLIGLVSAEAVEKLLGSTCRGPVLTNGVPAALPHQEVPGQAGGSFGPWPAGQPTQGPADSRGAKDGRREIPTKAQEALGFVAASIGRGPHGCRLIVRGPSFCRDFTGAPFSTWLATAVYTAEPTCLRAECWSGGFTVEPERQLFVEVNLGCSLVVKGEVRR
jgi:hypothetical protein